MFSRYSFSVLAAGLLACSVSIATAQQPDVKAHPEWNPMSSLDNESPRAAVETFLRLISAAKGATIDVARLNSLFLPSGRIEMPVATSEKGAADAVFVSPAQYAAFADKGTATTGCFDRALAVHVEHFGVIAQVFASYASRTSPQDEKPFRRGIKSFDLVRRNSHWYISKVAWDFESPDNAILPGSLVDRDE